MGCCHPKRETDQGWAWLAFLASCIIHYMVFGMHYSFGILFPSLIKEFGEGEGKTGKISVHNFLVLRRRMGLYKKIDSQTR